MTLDTEPRIETQETGLPESVAKPPPYIREDRGYGLFQTMDELHARHGNAKRAKDRVMHVTGAFAGGLALFLALYALILFLE